MKHRLVHLKEVAEFINGTAFKPSDWSDSGLPIIRIQNLTGTSDVFNRFDGAIDERVRVCRSDILISWSASLGVYRWQGHDAVLNQHIFKVRLGEGVEPDYFYYVATNAVQEMVSRVHGSTMQHITKDRFDSIQIRLPELPEQRRIAGQLAQADRLRRTRRYALELTDTFLPAAFLELFGDPQTNSKNWDRGIIEDVVLFSQYGTSRKSNSANQGYPILGMGNITDKGYLDLSTLACVDLSKNEFQGLALRRGDIIFNRTNSAELVGKTTWWNLDMNAVLASYLIRLRLKPEVLPEFFSALLNTRYFKNLFRDRCKKAVGQSNVSPTLLKEFPVYIPPLPLQEKFAAMVARVERLRAVQSEASRQAEHHFASLLHRAFST